MEKYRRLFESIFKSKLTDADTVSRLKNITAEHPYFSIAHFYLLSLYKKNTIDYKNQVRKTAILFNNNHWLNFQLLESGFDSDAGNLNESVSFPQSFPEKITDEVFATKNNLEVHAGSITDIFSTTEREEAISEEVNPSASLQKTPIEEEISLEESGEIEPVVINEPVIAEAHNTIDEVIMDETELPGKTGPIEKEIENPEAAGQNTSMEEVIVDDPKKISTPTAETAAPEMEIETDPKPDTALHEPILKETAPVAENTDQNVNEPKPQETLLFEPLHTTDYFASVGIKLSEVEKNSGSLGKQLKSFTEWLKTMKKVHAAELSSTKGPSDVLFSAAESNIQQLAEKSNQGNEVLTEAMAEVLLQQGKSDKAIEILEKLSLLNPGKSVYFAAKINQIKEK